jgi:hypothetical protein
LRSFEIGAEAMRRLGATFSQGHGPDSIDRQAHG